ncbi:PIG-L family deacetylase [Rhodobacteraceae bacterium CCMM004]|nr:PIG-L family deacetylase [Rhodobacteraceae bacterium CCMM004]
MPTPDQRRLDDDRRHPWAVALWRALRPLTSVARFLQSGAHPDDEISGMLAALGLRDGLSLAYVCATRGEGGQNDIGTEAGAALGALRTREMERAADVLGMRLYWLSDDPADPVTDFGFSKSGEETLARWGAERTLRRLVEVIRAERPDILCPTFLDVPGQHGHHRAMTQAAHDAFAAAADPGFDAEGAPWAVAKLYLPAWSGAGQAYDDDLPPPPATTAVPGDGGDPVTGWTWERIGQQSRAYHRTQGMGRWVPPGAPSRDWPLHLATSRIEGPDAGVTAGLPQGLADLADGAPRIAGVLRTADAACAEAVAAWPDGAAVAAAAWRALAAVETALTDAPDAIAHRLAEKRRQLGHVLRLATRAEADARIGARWIAPGEGAPVEVGLAPGTGAATADLALPEGWAAADGRLTLGAEAVPVDAYRSAYDPAARPAPAVTLRLAGPEATAEARVAVDSPPVALPPRRAVPVEDRLVLNLARPGRDLTVALRDVAPEGAAAALDLPEGWTAAPGPGGVRVTVPSEARPGLHILGVTVDGGPAMAVSRIDHPHVDPTAWVRPAEVQVRLVDVALPEARIGYAGSGHDRVAHWLAAIGADVTELSDADLADHDRLAAFDSIVIGIFALRFRPGLAAAMGRMRAWVEDGGTLVTLYHRPWDNWDPQTIPPRPLTIGQPSLRWRVTDEAAAVTPLAAHPLLSGPNPIGPEDWEGWVKERGLYFASAWNDAYVPLVEMTDPGEAPHRGALLAADVGRGRHVHCALILHHQMAHLVPGAFRLMANLVAPRR